MKGNKKSQFLVSQWSSYSNAKVSLTNTVEKGHIFEGKFKPFTPEEIMKVMGVYIIDGLPPSTRLVQKMQQQMKQCTYGNEFIDQSVGPVYQKLH